MVAAVGSFVGGTVSIVGLMLITPPLAKVMIAIGPSVQVVLLLLALSVIAVVSAGSRLKTTIMMVLGLLLTAIGLDHLDGVPRLTFGNTTLAGGLSFTSLAIGLFGISEILINLEKTELIKAIQPKFRDLIPRMKDVRDAAPAIGRASVIGFIFGIIPGVSHVAMWCRRSCPMRWKSGFPATPRSSVTAPSPVSRGQRPPTTRSPARP